MRKIFASGLIISFLGNLPFGVLNLTAFKIAASQNVNKAMVFVFAVILVELFVVAITLYGAGKINFDSKYFYFILPLGIGLLAYLSITSFEAAFSKHFMEINSSYFPVVNSTFTLGILLSMTNPMQFPFWMGWNRFLMNRKTLVKKPGIYPAYLVGIGFGSMAGFMVFILSGKILIQTYQEYHEIFSFSLGLAYLLIALFLTYKFYRKYFYQIST